MSWNQVQSSSCMWGVRVAWLMRERICWMDPFRSEIPIDSTTLPFIYKEFVKNKAEVMDAFVAGLIRPLKNARSTLSRILLNLELSSRARAHKRSTSTLDLVLWKMTTSPSERNILSAWMSLAFETAVKFSELHQISGVSRKDLSLCKRDRG